MYQILASHSYWPALSREAGPAIAALVTAELFYKFHSFTLECIAFLFTWYVFSWASSHVIDVLGRR